MPGRATVIKTVTMKLWQADLKNYTEENEKDASQSPEAGFSLAPHSVVFDTVKVTAEW